MCQKIAPYFGRRYHRAPSYTVGVLLKAVYHRNYCQATIGPASQSKVLVEPPFLVAKKDNEKGHPTKTLLLEGGRFYSYFPYPRLRFDNFWGWKPGAVGGPPENFLTTESTWWMWSTTPFACRNISSCLKNKILDIQISKKDTDSLKEVYRSHICSRLN